jgi:hypothetical protein
MTVGEWLCHSDSPRCDALLACGALIVAELRAAVLAETQFTCSAGIGHNKVCCVLCECMGSVHSGVSLFGDGILVLGKGFHSGGLYGGYRC